MTEDWTEAFEAKKHLKTRVDALVQEDFKDAGSATAPEQTIYHYTNVKGALGIIQTGRIWFTERAHLNDPLEIHYGLGIAQELFELAANQRKARIAKEAPSRLIGEH